MSFVMRMNAWISLAVAVLAWGAAAAAIGARPADVDAARIRRAETDGRDWPSHGRTYSEQRYSPLTQINDGNVARLGLAWTQTLDYERGVETTPIVVDGVMYATGPGAWSMPSPPTPASRSGSSIRKSIGNAVSAPAAARLTGVWPSGRARYTWAPWTAG